MEQGNEPLTSFRDVAVAILAGGLATRLLPVTATIPKVLLDVAGKPFPVQWQLERILESPGLLSNCALPRASRRSGA